MMKKLLVLSALVALVTGGLAGPALAEHGTGQLRDQLRGLPDDGLPTGEVTGRVVDIDHIQGALTLQTTRGLLALQGPPEALENVRIGDLVRVRVALGEEGELPAPLDEERR